MMGQVIFLPPKKKLAELFDEQQREGLRRKVKMLLDASEIALKDYRRCENLKQDFCQLLFEIANERDHVLRKVIRLVEIEGVEPLKKAGFDFKALQSQWRSLAQTVFDFNVNERISACTTRRYSLLNELFPPVEKNQWQIMM